MNKKLLIVALALALAAPAGAQTGGAVIATAPGKAVIADTVKIVATITAIDKASRDVTLKGPQGNLVTVTAGPDVKNFDRLKVGDQVELAYVEALSLELKKGGKMVVGRTEQAGSAVAKPGTAPGGAVGRQVTVIAEVVSLDPAKQIVTLKGPQQTINLRIADPEQFRNIAKGDKVEAKFMQALAVAVEPAKK
jgi:Cu/Ag efflux protein CusF